MADKLEEARRRAEAGDAAAMFNLALVYDKGDGAPHDPAKAREWYEKAAEAGNAKAMFNLGLMYDEGDEVPKNAAKARKWYERAGEAGNPRAMFNLGLMYEKGDGVRKDPAKARKWWETAGEAGQTEAMYNLGLMYLEGHGVRKDPAKAREWWEKAAEAGKAEAMVNLGLMYAKGDGVPKDLNRAREWYEKAGGAGNADAMFYLGVMYDQGHTVPKDRAKARQWYEKAGQAGNPKAMFNLGVMYEKGRGVPEDLEKAREWYEKAAEAGQAEAMLSLGVMYEEVEGVRKDVAKAREWYQRAAEAGDAKAMFNLGVIYHRGDGLPEDPAKARKWWKRAAQAGNAEAMFTLGLMYRRGDGVRKDAAKARQWYEKAAAARDAKAMFNLGLMYHFGEGVPEDSHKAREWYEEAAEAGQADAMFNLGGIYCVGEAVPEDLDKAREWWLRCAKAGHECGWLIRHMEEMALPAEHWVTFLRLYIQVRELRDEHRAVGPDGEACHFTTVGALRSTLALDKEGNAMLGSNHLRMYNIGYVNDPTDGRALIEFSETHAGNHLLFPLHRFFEKPTGRGDAATSTVAASDVIEESEPVVFFASFTRQKDRLDLWRAYGRDGTGCCIVIPPSAFADTPGHFLAREMALGPPVSPSGRSSLADGSFSGTEDRPAPPEATDKLGAARDPTMALYEVRYTDDEKLEALRTLDWSRQSVQKLCDRTELPEDREEVSRLIRMILAEILFLYKNEEYQNERELRMICTRHGEDPSIKLDDGNREGGVRHRYVCTRPFLFAAEGYEIVLGPKVESKYAVRQEIEHRLHKHGFTGVNVRDSDVPYR